MNLGDTIYCEEDIAYEMANGDRKVIKAGHKLILRAILESRVIAERYGKPFLLEKSKCHKYEREI